MYAVALFFMGLAVFWYLDETTIF